MPAEPRAGGSGARQPRNGPSRAVTTTAARSMGPAPLPGGTQTAGSEHQAAGAAAAAPHGSPALQRPLRGSAPPAASGKARRLPPPQLWGGFWFVWGLALG